MQATSQCFDCSGCGDCCRGRFAIIISEADRDRIEKQGWTDDDLKLGGKPLFRRRPDGYQLAHRSDGACVFLNDKGLCEIHARHGAAAKPLPCRLYPFEYVPLGGQVRVDVRLDCPTAAANKGRSIDVHRGELLELVHDAVPERAACAPVPPLHGRQVLTWAQLIRINDHVEKVLLDISLDITRRVGACVRLADLLRQAPAGSLDGKDADEFLEMAVSHVQEMATLDALLRTAPERGVSLAFRQVAGIYGRMDRVGERPNIFGRFRAGMRMLQGKGAVPLLSQGFPEVAFTDLEKPFGIPAGDAALSLERYLQIHLSAMSFFGQHFYGRSYVDGLKALLLTFPLICWFGRAFAVAEGRDSLSAADVERAMAIVDHNHGVTPALDVPTERLRMRMLCEPDTLRNLITWYGT